MTQQNNWRQLMKCVVELNHHELKEAIRDYLLRHGHCLSDPTYGTPLEFELGELEVGNQREPKSVKTVTKVFCTLA
jgi:hypothetical protein